MAPIASYDWTFGLGDQQSGFYQFINVGWGATGVHLVVTDALGKTGSADGVILVYEPPPPPPPRDDGCTIWEISYDGGYTWYPLGTTCP
jgi:hypothetical protein